MIDKKEEAKFQQSLNQHSQILNIFKEIDKAIEETISPIPVCVRHSQFYRRYLQIREKYLLL